MPTIEITDAHAQALARGESITLEPPTPPAKRYLVMFDTGNTFDVLLDQRPVAGRPVHFTNGVLVAKGPHTAKIGYRQRSGGGTARSFIEFP